MLARQGIAVVVLASLLVASVGCSSDDSETAAPTTRSTQTREESPRETETTDTGPWGRYPASASLDEQKVVETYVAALNNRDGKTFCRVVAPWVSGRFDLLGTDPDASLAKPLRCPGLVAALIDFPWENKDPFRRATIDEFGQVERSGDLVSVPISVTLRLEEHGSLNDRVYEKPLEDVVWLTRDSGAWRVAKPSKVAAAASVAFEPEGNHAARPDLDAERRVFAAEVAAAERRRAERAAAYREVTTEASCEGAKRFGDGGKDVVDYRHPAPPTPTPQLPAADIRAVEVEASDGRICVVFELAGDVRTGTTFQIIIQSTDFDWRTKGFAQNFDVELRGARARVSSGLDKERRPLSVPASVGRSGNRLALVVDGASFAAGEPVPASKTDSRPLDSFRFIADVTVVLSEKRYLHDDLGPGPPDGPVRFDYP